MPAGRVKGRPSDTNGTIELSDLAAGIAEAVVGAKVHLDQQAVAIADQYKASAVLRLLAPPAFAIGEVRIAIRFAIAQVQRRAPEPRGSKSGPIQVYVHVDAASLAEIAPHLVSEIELRIAPEMRRPQPAGDDGETVE